ncbi:GNAT family N-acetyltransferase [Persicitalea sp.]|uniref:GNAT family N-acetyltransferase n=1 Tax=Persicitalea sp. TaxID=3100273 RepID=UPI003592ECFD
MSDEHKNEPGNQWLSPHEAYEIRIATASTMDDASGFALYLYNTTQHLATQRHSHPFSMELRRVHTKQTVALLRADHDDEEAVSLPHAPFGGLEFAEEVPHEVLCYLISTIEDYCRTQQLSKMTVRLPPASYDSKGFAVQEKVYEDQGYSVVNSLINHHIPVDDTPFIDRIHPSERKRLRKCQRAGFEAEKWDNPDPSKVFSFLAESRKRQGYALSLDLEQLQSLLAQLPDKAKVFVVKDGEEIISLTVAIRVNQRILYNFCPADNLDYRAFSPTVLLNKALYEYAQNEGVELIDLGVSLDHLGNEKASLICFKENLGGHPSAKLTYQKIFE